MARSSEPDLHKEWDALLDDTDDEQKQIFFQFVLHQKAQLHVRKPAADHSDRVWREVAEAANPDVHMIPERRRVQEFPLPAVRRYNDARFRLGSLWQRIGASAQTQLKRDPYLIAGAVSLSALQVYQPMAGNLANDMAQTGDTAGVLGGLVLLMTVLAVMAFAGWCAIRSVIVQAKDLFSQFSR